MSTARMPARKMPSKVPAPPMLATGAPRRLMAWRLLRSAPMRVPRTPEVYATVCGWPGARMRAATAAAMGGRNAGLTMPTPLTGLATRWVTTATARTATRLRKTVCEVALSSR